ncbi:glycogen debranching N-terminal domain-containing protein [Glycomyces sp. NPDC021274]|uniref:glycogen debranching N-terminal domain-containing protein n=1 Tax=Glycomyces sp. NPDC021274 TaxID=3155120 RepID=UPI003407A3C7
MTSGRQPFLHDAVIALHAPTQAWSRADGAMTAPIDGLFHGDRRFVRGLQLEVEGEGPEPIATGERNARTVAFEAVLRGVDDDTPDPHVGLTRVRTVAAGRMSETLTVTSVLDHEVTGLLRLRVEPDFRTLQDVKSGGGAPAVWEARIDGGRAAVTGDGSSFALEAGTGAWSREKDELLLEWPFAVRRHHPATLTWSVTAHETLVVGAVSRPPTWTVPAAIADERLAHWVEHALDDLDALRLALPDHPDDVFLAAGAPWFLTLFGRDSLWAARMLLPFDVPLAASTLRVLARLQGTRDDAASEEEPGKVPHELRAATFEMPTNGLALPPLYYGTVDATPLWVCLLVDAWRAGMPADEVAALIPNLRAALAWIDSAAGEDGFLTYIDRTGNGLSNQGWKDSADSIQWRDGRLANGPIALCEAQGYAHEAALGAAALLEAFGEQGAGEWRAWAGRLRTRFNERFWVTTPEGSYPAIALDRNGAAVDTLTSNIGHLLGTGILDPDAEARIAEILIDPSMRSGYGIRTMSTAAAGYWPLSYHGGAVWAHDSAIIAHGMARTGHREQAAAVVDDLLHAAAGFDYRIPELHAGTPRSRHGRPTAYPAACRPQAWSAAAAMTCLQISQAHKPDLTPPPSANG